MRRRRYLTVASCMLAAALLCGCQGQNKEAEEAGSPQSAQEGSYTAEEPLVLKMGMANSGTDPLAIYAEKVCDEVKERTGGRVVIEFYPNNELGTLSDLVEQSQRGTPLITMCSSDFWQDFAPDLGALNAPYMFDDWQKEVPLIAKSDWMKEQEQLLRDHDLELLLAGFCVGPRHMVSNIPLETPDDLKGLKFRTSGGTVFVAMAETLGCAPVTTTWSDVYQSLQQGVVDVAEGDYGLLDSISIWEVADYLNLTGHISCDNLFCMSTKVYAQLTEEDQQILKDCLAEKSAELAEYMAGLEEDYLKKFEEKGMKIVEVDKEAYKKATATTLDSLTDMTSGIYSDLQKYMSQAD